MDCFKAWQWLTGTRWETGPLQRNISKSHSDRTFQEQSAQAAQGFYTDGSWTPSDGDSTTPFCSLFQWLTILKMRYRRKKINPYLENQMVLPYIVSKDSRDASWDRNSLPACRTEKHLVTSGYKLIFGMTRFVTMCLTCQDSKFHD